MARLEKQKTWRLSVFKGREAKLNKAIFQTLALKGDQTIYDIHKQIRTLRGLRYTRYASVNKRIKALEETGYIKKIGVKKTRVGLDASIYRLTVKAFLAIVLNLVNLEELVSKADETTASSILSEIIYATN